MLSETFITSILAPNGSKNHNSKDVGIFSHSLHPTHAIQSTCKKSSTAAHALARNASHIFAAQADKAVLHVYSSQRANQEALVSFPERLHSICLLGDALVVLGTAEGRLILWEICSGRQVFTRASHLQPVTCLATSPYHLVSGSEDSNIHLWSIPSLLSLASTADTHEPMRSLSNHRSAITSLSIGHGSSGNNILVSASKDNTCIVWNYHTGALLRTFLLHSTPLCTQLDPGERAAYVGFDDGTIQLIDFFSAKPSVNPMYDHALQSAPVQVDSAPWEATRAGAVGAVQCLGLSFDGTTLLSGHASGKVIKWDAGARSFSAELVDLAAPVTNLHMISPFPHTPPIKAVTVVKPRMSQTDYTITGQLLGTLGTSSDFQAALKSPGIPAGMLERAIQEFSRSAAGATDAKVRKENEELWKIIAEQRALQKKTYEKYVHEKQARKEKVKAG